MRATIGLCAAMVLVAAFAWAGETPALRPPEHLSDTGLYAAAGSFAIDASVLSYAPQYPLWSDGAAKSRWIYLPPGQPIGAEDDAAWVFPVGTKLWKEFAFNGKKVETRMIWQAGADAWVFASYVWNDEQTDATLAPEGGIRDHVAIASAKSHSIPAVSDCRNCHESGPSRVLGFNALQLSDDRDPLAVHGEPLRPGMVTLADLVASHRLTPERFDLVQLPPRIPARSPRERAVLGYFAGNCAHCHNATGPLARLGLVLAHQPTRAGALASENVLSTLIDAKGRFQVPGVPDGVSRLVAPGAPDSSAVVYRMRSRRPASQMPPLGTVIADAAAAALVTRWIAEDLAAP